MRTSGPTRHLSRLPFETYAPDRRLCLHTSLVSYLERTLDSRGIVPSLFLTPTVPRRAASRETLRRWTRDFMGLVVLGLVFPVSLLILPGLHRLAQLLNTFLCPPLWRRLGGPVFPPSHDITTYLFKVLGSLMLFSRALIDVFCTYGDVTGALDLCFCSCLPTVSGSAPFFVF